MDIERLKELAENATPGPWWVEIDENEDGPWASKWPTIESNKREIVGTEGLYGDIDEDKADAEYIAACSPDVILELIQRLEEAESERLEQARLLGMSAERELSLLARLENK